MILGLVRHFKVIMPAKKILYSSLAFRNALDIYDEAPVRNGKVDLKDISWEICYSSTLPRAEYTAKSIFGGKIIANDLIREVPMTPFTDSGILLPSFIWHIGARIAWFRNKDSQPETRDQTLKRINEFLEIIKDSGHSRVLVVTHGFFMRVLTEHLLKNGFKGKIDDRPRNGRLYVFSDE